MAIKELENISLEDGNGYIEAKKLMAEYNNNLSEIQQRKKAEEKSIEAFNYAKN